ncbi:acetylcholine receptor subunit alpha-like [Mercenaria mercenaria]|uniref:acetylcholine receptor subunit alpha-like n=1 Tax=Mercenaria mercenaria TaxID=6596 RepID=UPI00234F193E|nr:acetylcholine receptor subunit alpha-like [Mercenaria mercenaria]
MSDYDTLMEFYNSGNYSRKDFIPKANVSVAINVSVSVDLLALNDFNEVSGSIDLMIGLNLRWTDEIVQCNGYDLATVFNATATGTPDALKSLLVPYGKIWSPNMVLLNAMDSATTIGGSIYKLRFDLTEALVTWNPKVHVYSSCTPDVTYYPFDRQTCTFTFLSWGNTASELLFKTDRSTLNLGSYSDNGEWKVSNSKMSVPTVNSQSQIEISITIDRRPLYFAFNIITPIMVLVILNGMVFWLPVESGERIGFSVTCFLSFVVLLNMIMDLMPKSSSPIAYICFYTVCMMVFSGLNTALVILQMRMFHKPETDEVPSFIVSYIRFMKCQTCKRNTNKDKINSVKVEPSDIREDPSKTKGSVKSDRSEFENEGVAITWQDAAAELDKILFLTFLAGQTIFSILFLLPIFLL